MPCGLGLAGTLLFSQSYGFLCVLQALPSIQTQNQQAQRRVTEAIPFFTLPRKKTSNAIFVAKLFVNNKHLVSSVMNVLSPQSYHWK